MVQSGLDSHIEEPEGGVFFQSVHKILQLKMTAELFFFSFAWMCTRGPGFESACNRRFVLKADTKVWGLFCIGREFGSFKGLTVISEMAKGDRASVIILFTSIMELNIEEVIAGSRCTTTIASTQGGSSLIPPHFWGLQRGEASVEGPTQRGRSECLVTIQSVLNAFFFCCCRLLTLLAHLPFLSIV